MKHIDKILKLLSESTSGNQFDFNSRAWQWNKKTYIKLDEDDLKQLCVESQKLLADEPTLLEIKAPVTIVGDIHGQFFDLIHFMRKIGPVPDRNYLFLGDYVDRGNNSVETISFLLALKMKFPNHIWILRGNHESPKISQVYGFLDECQARYSVDIWTMFNKIFSWLPLAAVISGHIFCVHGGLSPELKTLNQIKSIKKPIIIPENGLISDLLWSDPVRGQTGYKVSSRETSFTYGEDVVNKFLQDNNLDLICRAHELVNDGYQFPFAPHKTLMTIFSAPFYKNTYKNKAAALKVNKNLECSFTLIDPTEKVTLSNLYPYPISFKQYEKLSKKKKEKNGIFKLKIGHKSSKKEK